MNLRFPAFLVIFKSVPVLFVRPTGFQMWEILYTYLYFGVPEYKQKQIYTDKVMTKTLT